MFPLMFLIKKVLIIEEEERKKKKKPGPGFSFNLFILRLQGSFYERGNDRNTGDNNMEN